jgi:hypothetical protein
MGEYYAISCFLCLFFVKIKLRKKNKDDGSATADFRPELSPSSF